MKELSEFLRPHSWSGPAAFSPQQHISSISPSPSTSRFFTLSSTSAFTIPTCFATAIQQGKIQLAHTASTGSLASHSRGIVKTEWEYRQNWTLVHTLYANMGGLVNRIQ